MKPFPNVLPPTRRLDLLRRRDGGLSHGGQGPATLVAVGTSVTAYSLDDGLTWQLGTIPAGTWLAIGYGNGVWVAVGENVAAVSTDGKTFTAVAIAAGTYRSVKWSPKLKLFAAVGTNVAATSTDGTSWTPQTIPAGTYTGLAWADSPINVFCAVKGVSKPVTSPDGTTWTENPGSPPVPLVRVAWSPKLKIFDASQTSGTGGATSVDGVAWVSHAIGQITNAIAWATGPDVFAVVATGGTNPVRRSVDGISWVQGTIAGGTHADLVWTGRQFVTMPALATSPDGLTYTDVAGFPLGTWAAMVANR